MLDTTLPADVPLSREEVEAIRRHLAFIRTYRGVLRPKLNAKEDLLVNGARKPTHRGTCQHLLQKIDAATIRAALRREPVKSDPARRAEFLAGAAAISGDVGVLLLFLETLDQVASSEQLVGAFMRALERIDFEGLSAARMSRLLDIMESAFDEHELSGALFGLLHTPGFRKAFDACAADLKPGVAARFVPLRAIYDAVPTVTRGKGKKGRRRRRRQDRVKRPDPALSEGLRMMLSAPPAVLTSHSTPARRRLLELALQAEADWTVAHPGILTLLRSFPERDGVLADHGLGYAEHLIRRGAYDAARSLLRDVADEPKAPSRVKKLLARLDRPRLAHFAVEARRAASREGLQPAYWLRELRRVLVRFGKPGTAAVVSEEATLQAEAFLPGVAGVLAWGADDERPWVALAPARVLLGRLVADRGRKLSRSDVLDIALAGVRILRALGLAGIALPDAHPRRFVANGKQDWDSLKLADFAGAQKLDANAAGQVAGRLSVEWCRSALSYPPFSGRALRRDLSFAHAKLEECCATTPRPEALAAVLVDVRQEI